MAGTIHNPPVPYVHNTGNLYPNKMIIISGIPHRNPSRFTVYLQHGLHQEPDIAMCVDARFIYGNDRHVIVRNSRVAGGWGTEDRPSQPFPFMPNVAVNNQHLPDFNHRLKPLNRVNTLRIDGDLRLTKVGFQ